MVTDVTPNRRDYLKAMGVIAGGSALAGCMGDDGDDGSADLFTYNLPFLEDHIVGTDDENGYFDDFEEEFGDEYDVEWNWSDEGPDEEDVVSHITGRLQDGDPPEVFNTLFPTYMQYSSEGDNVFADLEQFDGIDELEDRMLEGTFENTYVRDSLYSIPWYVGTPATYSNVEFFEDIDADPPSLDNRYTTDDYLDTAEELVNNSDAETGMNFHWDDIFASFFRSEGIDILNEDNTEAAFNTDRTVEIMERFQDLTEDGVISEDTWVGEWNDHNELFAAEIVGMMVGSDSALRPVQDFGEEWVSDDTVAIGPVPDNEEYGGHLEPTPIGVVSAGDKSEEVQEASFAMITVILNEHWQEMFLRDTTVMVPHEQAMENMRTDEEWEEDNPLLVQLYDNYETVGPDTQQALNVEGASEVWDQFKSNFQEIGLGNVDPEEGVENAEEEINATLGN